MSSQPITVTMNVADYEAMRDRANQAHSMEIRNNILAAAITIANEDNRKLTLDRDAHAEKLTAAQKTIETLQGRTAFRAVADLAAKVEAFDRLVKRYGTGPRGTPKDVLSATAAIMASIAIAELVADGRYVRRPETRDQRLDVLARQGELIGDMDGMEVVGVTLHSAEGSQMPVALNGWTGYWNLLPSGGAYLTYGRDEDGSLQAAAQAVEVGVNRVRDFTVTDSDGKGNFSRQDIGMAEAPTVGLTATEYNRRNEKEAASRVEGPTSTHGSAPVEIASLDRLQEAVRTFLPGWELVRHLSPNDARVGAISQAQRYDR